MPSAMSLIGNLQTMSLPDILQWVASGRKTGTLHIERRSIQKDIIFRDGKIASSKSTDPRESLGQFLIREQRLTEEQLFRTLSRQEEEGRLLGSILVEEKILLADDLRHTLRSKAEESIYDLFLWPDGAFEFREGDLPREVHVQIELDVTSVIMEGIRRVDEWERIRRIFTSSAATFQLHGTPDEADDPIERQLLELVAAGKTLAEIGLELRRSEFATAALLFDAHARDRISVSNAPPETPPSDPVDAIRELLSTAYQRLQERRFDAALQAYESALAIDRLNQHAKKGLLAVSEARTRERAKRSIPLDKIPVLRMDLGTLTRENFDPQEGFVLSRINGQWDVRSILKICPMSEEDTLLIFAWLYERQVIDFQ